MPSLCRVSARGNPRGNGQQRHVPLPGLIRREPQRLQARSEEHTSELQSHVDLVCRLLLEKKKKIKTLKCLFNTSITHSYNIVICSKPITLNATGCALLTTSQQFRHSSTSDRSRNNAMNST